MGSSADHAHAGPESKDEQTSGFPKVKKTIPTSVQEREKDTIEQDDNVAVLPADTFDGRRLMREGGSVGVKGVLRLAIVAALFAIPNLTIFGVSIQRLFATGYTHLKLAFVLLVLALGIGATYYALHRSVQYILIRGVEVIYQNLSFLFRRISERLVDKAAQIFEKQKVDETKIARALDIGKMVNAEFEKMPKLLRTGIIMVLKRTPLSGMLIDLKSEIQSGNKQEASLHLYKKVDGFIRGTIFDGNGTGLLWLILPLNLLVSILLIVFFIG